LVTQKDVARLARVSFITVSRVVNGEDNVRPQTRDRVLAAIEKLGYIPSFAGKALNTGRNDTIGVMIPRMLNGDPEYALLIHTFKGILSACNDLKIDVLLTTTDADNGPNEKLYPYKQRKADGMLYLGLVPMTDNLAEEIAKHRIPCVAIAARPDHQWVSWIDADYRSAGFEPNNRVAIPAYRVPLTEMGNRGASMLIDLIRSGNAGRRTELLPIALESSE
jgi:LacI family transcriptional regulator